MNLRIKRSGYVPKRDNPKRTNTSDVMREAPPALKAGLARVRREIFTTLRCFSVEHGRQIIADARAAAAAHAEDREAIAQLEAEIARTAAENEEARALLARCNHPIPNETK